MQNDLVLSSSVWSKKGNGGADGDVVLESESLKRE